MNRDFPRGIGPLGFWSVALPIVGDLAGKLLDGDGGGSSTCPEQERNEVITFVLQRLNASEREEFSRLLLATKPSWYGGNFNDLFAKAYDVAFGLAGGSDCKVGTDAGRRWVDFWQRMKLKYYGQLGVSAPASPGPTTSGGDYVYLPNTGPSVGDAVTPDVQSQTTEESAFKGALRDLTGALATVFGQTAKGAVAGATASAEAAAAAAERQTVSTGAGQSLAFPLAGVSITTLLVIGLAIVAVLFAFRRR